MVSDQRWESWEGQRNVRQTRIGTNLLRIKIEDDSKELPDDVRCDIHLIEPKTGDDTTDETIAHASYNFATDVLSPGGRYQDDHRTLKTLSQHREVVENRRDLPVNMRGYATTLLNKIDEALIPTVASRGRFPH